MTDDRRPGIEVPGRLSVSMSCRSSPQVSRFPGGAAPDGATDLRRGTSLSLPSPTGVCSFCACLCCKGTGFSGRLMLSVARPRKKAKNSPGMRLPVPDSRRNGKSHILGSAASVRTATPSKTPGVLFNLWFCIRPRPAEERRANASYGPPLSGGPHTRKARS